MLMQDHLLRPESLPVRGQQRLILRCSRGSPPCRIEGRGRGNEWCRLRLLCELQQQMMPGLAWPGLGLIGQLVVIHSGMPPDDKVHLSGV